MQVMLGDMWSVYEKVDLFCVTTNSSIKLDGTLVMGKGIAAQARDRLRDIALCFGAAIRKSEIPSKYGLVICQHEQQKMGAFQVKTHYSDKAVLSLIRYSSQMLFKKLLEHPTWNVAVNFPGIGNGGLEIREVLPIVSLLPNNVTLWINNKEQYNKYKDLIEW